MFDLILMIAWTCVYIILCANMRNNFLSLYLRKTQILQIVFFVSAPGIICWRFNSIIKFKYVFLSFSRSWQPNRFIILRLLSNSISVNDLSKGLILSIRLSWQYVFIWGIYRLHVLHFKFRNEKVPAYVQRNFSSMRGTNLFARFISLEVVIILACDIRLPSSVGTCSYLISQCYIIYITQRGVFLIFFLFHYKLLILQKILPKRCIHSSRGT